MNMRLKLKHQLKSNKPNILPFETLSTQEKEEKKKQETTLPKEVIEI